MPPLPYKSPFSLTMVVPALDEEELLEDFLHKSMRDLAAVTDDYEVILIDDGSRDRTYEIARQLQGRYPQLRIIRYETNRGTGYNMIEALQSASNEVVFVNTVDAFFDTADLPRYLPLLRQCDSLSCYRTDLRANNLYQKLLTLVNSFLVRKLFSLPLRAVQTLQFHRSAFLKSIRFEARSSFIAPEMLYKARRRGLKILEAAFVFHARRAGKPKGGRLRFVLRSILDILTFYYKWRICGLL